MNGWNFSHGQAWTLLAVAGALEIAWAVGMKSTDGLSRLLPSAVVLVVALLSFVLLGLAMKTLPVGTAYAVWVGIGAAGAALLGIVLYGESTQLARLLCIAAIVGGVIGLKLLHE